MHAERHLCADYHRVLDWSVRVRIQSFPGIMSPAPCTLLLSSNFCFLDLLSLRLWGWEQSEGKVISSHHLPPCS